MIETRGISDGCFAQRPMALMLLSVTLLGTSCADARTTKLEIATFNINAGSRGLSEVGALLDAIDADVVALQEVDRGTRRSGTRDQLEELARGRYPHGVFHKTMDYDGGQYGIAILSRFPILRSRSIALPTETKEEPRGAIISEIDVAGKAITVANTHLGLPGLPPISSSSQVARVESLLGSLSGASIVLAGDINSISTSRVVREIRKAGFRDAWSRAGSGSGDTYATEFLGVTIGTRIVYIFVKGSVRVTAARVHPTSASDHARVVAELDF